jgi:hypothetical protein
VLFTRELAKQLPDSVETYSLHPGVIATNLSRSMGVFGAIYRAVGGLFLKSVAQGAATTVYAATAPELEDRSAAYLHDCAIVKPSPDAEDDALAKRLWTLSEEHAARADRAQPPSDHAAP